uniref:Protein tyrosine phosphatase n=1 Tax=Panagrolaimus sp. ES5 TaxID=591445 RepID=A0AC34G1I6_9BILA
MEEKKSVKYDEEWEAFGKPIILPALAFEEQERLKTGKNRYGSIECFDETRVILRGKCDYVHANFITSAEGKKMFIGSQGPTHDSMKDFWIMLLQEKVEKVIMLCGIFEESMKNGQKQMLEKSAKYWPVGENFDFKEFQVHFKSSVQKDYIDGEVHEYVVTTILEIIESSSKKPLQTVHHIHHRSWPDHGIPILVAPIVDIFKNHVEKSLETQKPVVVHCSAGIGRTGCFIAAYYCMDLFKKDALQSVSETVVQLRRMRARLVQRASQYLFIHLLLIELIELEYGDKHDEIKDKLNSLIKNLKKPRKHGK